MIKYDVVTIQFLDDIVSNLEVKHRLGKYWSTFQGQKNAFNTSSYAQYLSVREIEASAIFKAFERYGVGRVIAAQSPAPERFYVNPDVDLVRLGLTLREFAEKRNKATQPSIHKLELSTGTFSCTIPPSPTEADLYKVAEFFLDNMAKLAKKPAP